MWGSLAGLRRPAWIAASIAAVAGMCPAHSQTATPVHSVAAVPFETAAPKAVLLDYETGTVLLEKNSDAPTPPASLTKLMTIEVLFEQLRQGHISLDDTLVVSPHAWRTGGASSGGSTMFLKLNSQVSVRDLISGLIIQSGNDAAVVIAEGLAGSEEAFAAMMNERAKAIGLTGSHFVNPHGLPHPDEHVTMRDMATLAAHLIREFPDHYAAFKEGEFTYNNIRQRNRNPVLGLVDGADGLKTGHTAESGYSLVASAERNGRRLILAMGGLKSAKERAQEAQKLLEWGFRAFDMVTVAKAGEVLGATQVVGGEAHTVPLAAGADIKVLAPRGGGLEGLTTEVVHSAPLQAPVKKGDRAATLQIKHGDDIIREEPLMATETVAEGTILQRAWEAAFDFVAGQVHSLWSAHQPQVVGSPSNPGQV